MESGLTSAIFAARACKRFQPQTGDGNRFREVGWDDWRVAFRWPATLTFAAVVTELTGILMADILDKPTAALIYCDPNVGSLRIAALTLLDRLVVALHRGGCSPIRVVCPGELPSLQRSRALGISLELVSPSSDASGLVLIADCRMLVQPVDVKAVLSQRGRLVDAGGSSLPLGVVERFAGGEIDGALEGLAPVRAAGVAGRVENRESAAVMVRRLWASLGSSSDGMVDTYFNRPLGRFLSKVLIHTPVTPNQVTVVSALIGLASAWFFAQGNYPAGIIGALLLQLSALVDCVDGDLARVVFKESPIGKWLDLGLDQVVHVAVFATLAVGLSRAGADAPVMWLGVSAVAGALISFPVVVRARRLSNKDLDTKLEKFIDAASTRDFTALIVFLSVIGHLEWFLWLTGITVHIFWITALIMQLPKGASAGAAKSSGS